MHLRIRIFSPITILSLIFLFHSTSFSFGQNKVQYTNFSWKMLRSPHFKIHYHQDQGNLPNIALYWIEDSYKSLSEEFQFLPREQFPLIIYGDPNLFAQTNVITELLPEGVGGFTEFFKKRIVVPFNGSYTELRHVLHHELVHGFCYSILYSQFGSSILAGSNIQVPLWFMEGLAEYLSTKWDVEADMFLMDQVINGSVPLPGYELDGYMAYKGGQSFLFFLAQSRGDSTFLQLLREFKQTKSIDNCFKKVYGKSAEELGKEWIQELKRNYWPEIGKRDLPTATASPITSHREDHSNYNLRPRISPDGSKVAFFSDKKDFSSIVITDRKGKTLQVISQNGYGGYFETFHPFRSGISWSPDGNRLAFVTKSKGNDEIRIIDTKTKRLFRKIICSFTSVSSPDWSTDGKLLVFTAVDKGVSDIYTYNLESKVFSRLTNSIFCELDPRFTPDNKNVIFSVHDTSGKPISKIKPYGNTPSDLAIIDIASKAQRFLTHTPWNEKQVCISPDGKKCAFVSDRNGIDNIYIGSIDSLENAKPLTDFLGGCSNPDWSKDVITFSLFQQYGWDVWLMDKPESKIKNDTLAYTRWIISAHDTSALFFKRAPIVKGDSISKKDSISGKRQQSVSEKINQKDTVTGITEDSIKTGISYIDTTKSNQKTDSIKVTTGTDSVSKTTDSVPKIKKENKKDSIPKLVIPSPQPYRLSFSPDMISVGLGVNTYYGAAGQWLLSLSDLMGDHRITVAGDIQGNFQDYIHVFASYFYLKRRFDIGGGAFYNKDYTLERAYGDLLYHNTEYGGFISAEYPFSINSRIDLTLFMQNSEKEPVDTIATIIKTKTILPSLSYVYDNILWGITGPINGIRARVTTMVSPPFDYLEDQFASVDVDFRTYLHLFKRFVWANRIFFGGSVSLNDSSSGRRYFLGGNENWLFYKVNLDEYEKNVSKTTYSDFVTPFRGWSYIDLSGSRVALLNTEFRFPFIKEISVVWPMPMRIRYISGAFFTDVGNAWDAGEKHNGIPLPDKIYGGIGFGLRANLGMFVLRYDRGWPTDFKKIVKKPTNYFSLGGEF